MTKLVFGMMVLSGLLIAACGGDDAKSSSTTTAGATTAATTTSAATVAATTSAATATASTSAGSKQFTSQTFANTLTMTADSSWSVDMDKANWFTLKHAGDATQPAGFIDVFVPTQVYADDGITLQPVPSDLVSFIEGNKFLTEQSKTPVTVGGLSGTEIDVGSTASDEFKIFKVGSDDYAIDYNGRFRFEVLNGPTGQIVIGLEASPPSQADHYKPFAQSVVDTLLFTQ